MTGTRPMEEGATLGLEGKVALVTGASRGLGLAIARKLCAAGCHVFLNYAHSPRDAEKAIRALDGLKGTATALRGDVARPETLPGLLDAVRARHGRLDIFVHNAASWHPMPATRPVAEDFQVDLAVALNPLLRGSGGIADLMSGGPGRIIAVSSNGARSVIPQYVSLGVAKAALESLVRYLAAELAGRGIAVNAVSTAKIDKGPDTPNPEMARMLASRTPAGRLTRPEDVANVVALLCTDEAAWIHGQVITVDGGLGLRA